MSLYKINSSISGSHEIPIQLEPDTVNNTTSSVTAIDFGGCYVYMGHVVTYEEDFQISSFANLETETNYLENVESVVNGYIANDACPYTFMQCPKLSVFHAELPNLEDGSFMFRNDALTQWDINLPSLKNGESMFESTNLTSFNAELPNLINGENMFGDNYLVEWNIDLPSLQNGRYMFSFSETLTRFNGNLDNLNDGESMFIQDFELSEFNGTLSKLINGTYMFSSCKIKTWCIELPSLMSGDYMFNSCSELTSFESTMNSVVSCSDMFASCDKLKSVIIHTTMTEDQYKDMFNIENLGLNDDCVLTINTI